MSAAALWVYLPFLCGFFLLFFSEKKRGMTIFALMLCAFLTFIALRIPVNSMIVFGKTAIIFSADSKLLGRTMLLSRSEETIIAFFYFFAFLWCAASYFVKTSRFFIPVALMDIALVIAVMAVEPFVFGTFFITLAVLISLPLLWNGHKNESRPLFRFLFYQLLGMICLALGGWLASSVDMNPQDRFLLKRTVIMLFIGFSFWLAVFPFFTWIAALMEKTGPFLCGFVISLLQFSALFILLNFLNEHLWMRDYDLLFTGMRLTGMLMLLIGSIWACFQHDLQRVIAYISVAENGVSLLLLGLQSRVGVNVFLAYLFIHMPVLLIWSLAANYLSEDSSLELAKLRGLVHRRPVLSMTVLLAHFTVSGLPLFAGFPLRMSLISDCFAKSYGLGWSVAVGCSILLFSGFRLILIFLSPEKPNIAKETLIQRIMMIIGIVLLVLVGLFPGLFNIFISGISSQYAVIFK